MAEPPATTGNAEAIQLLRDKANIHTLAVVATCDFIMEDPSPAGLTIVKGLEASHSDLRRAIDRVAAAL